MANKNSYEDDLVEESSEYQGYVKNIVRVVIFLAVLLVGREGILAVFFGEVDLSGGWSGALYQTAQNGTVGTTYHIDLALDSTHTGVVVITLASDEAVYDEVAVAGEYRNGALHFTSYRPITTRLSTHPIKCFMQLQLYPDGDKLAGTWDGNGCSGGTVELLRIKDEDEQ